MSDEEIAQKRRIQWDGTITAGNVMTAASMVLLLLVWGLRLESRVDMVEERAVRSERLQDTAGSQLVGMRDTLARLQADQTAMLRAVTRIENALDRNPQQPGNR